METTRRIILAIVAAAFLVFAIAAIRDTVQRQGLAPVVGQVYHSSPAVAKADVVVVNPEVVKKYQVLYIEYQAQESLSKIAAQGSRSSELAQLHGFFVWRYLGDEYSSMNAAEKERVRDLRQTLPSEWERDYMAAFSIFDPERGQPEEVWESQYREDLILRGILPSSFK